MDGAINELSPLSMLLLVPVILICQSSVGLKLGVLQLRSMYFEEPGA